MYGEGIFYEDAADEAINATCLQAMDESGLEIVSRPEVAVEQIGKAGADLVSQDAAKMPELLALLQKYGAQAITQLKPEQLGAFATELRGLGAKL